MDFWSILGAFWAPKSFFFQYFSLSFFRFIFASIFLWFFVDFGPLESLILVLPPAREHNFYKIDVFRFVANFGPKIVVLRVPNPCKIEENRRTNVFQNTCLFNIDFFNFSSILAPKLRSQKVIFFVIFFQMGQCGAQEAPKRPQERPKRPQEAPRGSQEPQRASHSGDPLVWHGGLPPGPKSPVPLFLDIFSNPFSRLDFLDLGPHFGRLLGSKIAFFSIFFLIIFWLHCWIIFFLIFGWFGTPGKLEICAAACTGAQFSQNWRFRLHEQIWFNNGGFGAPKSS